MLSWKVLGVQDAGKWEIPTQVYLAHLGQKAWHLELRQIHFQAFLALKSAFLVGTQLHAPRALKKATTRESFWLPLWLSW